MKKGVAEVLTSIILVLVVSGVIVLIVGPGILAKLKGVGDREQCRASAVVKAQIVSKNLAHTESPTNLQCKTQEIEITHKAITKQGKKIETLSWGDTAKNEASITAIKRTLANEMYDCWYQFKELDIFGDYNSNLRCVPCARIHVTPEAKNKLTETVGMPAVPSMYEYLQTTTIPNSEQKFLEYLTDEQAGGIDFTGEQPLSLDTDYYVVYEASKDSALISAVTLGFCSFISCGGTEVGIARTAGRLATYIPGGHPGVLETARNPTTLLQTASNDQFLAVAQGDEGYTFYRYYEGPQGTGARTIARETFTATSREVGEQLARNPSLFQELQTAGQITRVGSAEVMAAEQAVQHIDSLALRSVSVLREGRVVASQAVRSGSRIGSYLFRIGGAVARPLGSVLTIGIVVIDVANQNEPLLSGVQLASVEDVANSCDQFY